MTPEHLEQLRRFTELQSSVPTPEEYRLEAEEFLDIGWREDWAELLAMAQTLPIAELLAELENVASETLRKAADDWQQGEWANAPRKANRISERLANAQYVADWLRARAAQKSTTTEL